MIRRSSDANIVSNPSNLSPLLQKVSSIMIDIDSVTNPPNTKSYTLHFLSSVLSRKGSGDGQFKNPCGIVIDKTSNYLYVTDKENHRIQKFDSNGRYVAKWGSKGSGDGQFNNPTGIAIDPTTDHVYVTDKENHRIQKFDSNGRYVAKWGSKGSGDGQFNNPTGIA